jgi:purine-binding chemotaxis protein CheW
VVVAEAGSNRRIKRMGDSVQLLVFVLHGQFHAVSLEHVERVVPAAQVTPVPGAPAIVLGIIDLHGRIVPVLDAHRGGNQGQPALRLSDQFVIIRTPLRTIALRVDGTHGVVERDAAAVSALGPALSCPDRGDGVVRLNDGLAVIDDVEAFLSSQEARQLDQALAAAAS